LYRSDFRRIGNETIAPNSEILLFIHGMDSRAEEADENTARHERPRAKRKFVGIGNSIDVVALIVRGAALASDIRREKNAALPLARQLMADDVWRSVIRTLALSALMEIDTPEARQLVQEYAPRGQ
jgi:hypothetical protein